MYLHTAFNLTISSPFTLPAARLTGPVPRIDVSIVCHEDPGLNLGEVGPECAITTASNEIVMRWDEVGEFRLCGGCQIEIRHRPGVSHDLLNLVLSGSVFAMLLYQRGLTVLHGSVVAVDDCAVAFVAPKGFGKSTLAMAMHGMGAPLISDDIVAIPTSTRAPVALNGFTQAKLWPDSLAHLGYSEDDHARLWDQVDKRGVAVSFGTQGSLPLRHIFILGRGDDLTFFPFEKKHALMTLLPHWYVGRYGTPTLRALGASAKQFTQCLSLVERVPVTALVRPTSLADLPRVAESVWRYVTQAGSMAAPVSSTAQGNVPTVALGA